MQTIHVAVGVDVELNIPQGFLDQCRALAQSDEASADFKAFQSAYPDDDEEFMLSVVKHGLRNCVRASIKTLLASSGVGGRISPASVRPVDYSYAEVVAENAADAGAVLPLESTKATHEPIRETE